MLSTADESVESVDDIGLLGMLSTAGDGMDDILGILSTADEGVDDIGPKPTKCANKIRE